MPSGQAHTTWFPELKELLKQKWEKDSSITEQFQLARLLNEKLNQIRKDLDIQPPIIWCPSCKERHRGTFSEVSITAMYYALAKEGICDYSELSKLRREWKKYSLSEGIDVYGNKKGDKESTKAQHKPMHYGG